MDNALEAVSVRRKMTSDLWNVTMHTNVLYYSEWRRSADRLLKEFQDDVVDNVGRGYTGGDPEARVWTFTASLMYSLTVFTTIGKKKSRYAIAFSPSFLAMVKREFAKLGSGRCRYNPAADKMQLLRIGF